jgi:hypothetical protein
MPSLGLLEIEDAETGRREIVATGGALAKQMAWLALERQASLLREVTRLKVDLIDIPAGQSPVQPLMAFFERRSHRR